MRISWLSAEEIAAARRALKADGRDAGTTTSVPTSTSDARRAARVSSISTGRGSPSTSRAPSASPRSCASKGSPRPARGSPASGVAIEAATLAAAAHQDDALDLDQVIDVLRCEIDTYVFYAPFLELMLALGRGDLDRAVQHVRGVRRRVRARAIARSRTAPRASAPCATGSPTSTSRAGLIEQAEALFETRHEEDRNDVAVALSASRAFLAAGSISHAVRWLGVGAGRAPALGRDELATRLRQKQEPFASA